MTPPCRPSPGITESVPNGREALIDSCIVLLDSGPPLRTISAGAPMTDNAAPALANFWNLREGFNFLWIAITNKDGGRTVAWATFTHCWGWPLLTVCILEIVWHVVFRVVGW